MTTLQSLQKEIDEVKKRNRSVEINKAWEISLARRLLLILFTYLSIGFYMQAISVRDPWLNAVVPSLGFLLSTLTLPFFKSIWIKKTQKLD